MQNWTYFYNLLDIPPPTGGPKMFKIIPDCGDPRDIYLTRREKAGGLLLTHLEGGGARIQLCLFHRRFPAAHFISANHRGHSFYRISPRN
jgi:hypothetical protein